MARDGQTGQRKNPKLVGSESPRYVARENDAPATNQWSWSDHDTVSRHSAFSMGAQNMDDSLI